MAATASKGTKTVETVETVDLKEKPKGLATVAWKILNEIFYKEDYQAFIDKIREPYNAIQRGALSPEEQQKAETDIRLARLAIKEEQAKLKTVYGGAESYASNLFAKLEVSIEAA